MKDLHIISLLEEYPFSQISDRERARIEMHVANCADCRRALASAQISAAMLSARAAETIEPSPFFQTRMMAAIREQQREREPLTLFNLWKAAQAFVIPMIALIVILGSLTFWSLSASQSTPSVQPTGNPNPYSAESVVFGEDNANLNDNISNGQVIEAVFSPEESNAEYR